MLEIMGAASTGTGAFSLCVGVAALVAIFDGGDRGQRAGEVLRDLLGVFRSGPRT